MRILFDDEIFFRQRFGGVSRIFATLLNQLANHPEHEVLFNCGYSENEYLLQLYPQTASFLRNHHFPLKGKLIRNIYGRRSHLRTNKLIARKAIDVFHPTFYADYYLPVVKKTNTPLVFTVHDLIHEQTNDNAHYKAMAAIKAQNIYQANQLIVVSEHTKKDLLNIYSDITPDKVNVIPLAQSLPDNASRPNYIPQQYVLFTGERGGYKNFMSLLKAFEILRKSFPELHLFCAGGRPFNAQELSLANELSVRPYIHQANLSDTELRFVYQHAGVFVFPSTYEGFGIPMLEAFSSKTPVVAHNATSLPEVGGDAAMYTDATNPTALAESIGIVLSNHTIRDSLIQKGLQRNQLFSWEKHVEQTLLVYQKALC